GYNKNFTFTKDSSENSPTPQIKRIRIRHLAVINIDAAILDDTISESSVTIHNVALRELNLAFAKDTTYSIDGIEATLKNLQHSKKGSLHAFAVSKIDYSSRHESLVADSFRVIPHHTKN